MTTARAKEEDAKKEKVIANLTLAKALARCDDSQRAFEDAQRAREVSKLVLLQAKDAAESAFAKLVCASAELDNASENASKIKEDLKGLMRIDRAT
mmetsp:Transcript_29262/g.86657  ORF Transcript_29262/g.86657 Transcript_29262/m.86657 type:complete len:96 (+) Transcript_29262:446-733(+)